MKSFKNIKSKRSFILIFLASLVLIVSASLVIERKNSVFTTQEINVSRGYHHGVKGELFFNKATYVQISVFKFLDRLWLSNITGALLNE